MGSTEANDGQTMYQDNVISGTEALHQSTNPAGLSMLMQGIKAI